jgi:ribosomal protein S21
MAAILVQVDRRPDESDEKLIRRFIKKTRREGIVREVMNRRAYKTKSQKRREKHAAAIHRKNKNEKINEE